MSWRSARWSTHSTRPSSLQRERPRAAVPLRPRRYWRRFKTNSSRRSTLPTKSARTKHSEETHLRYLIAGGAGFIGSNLCDRLIAEGHEVLCVDNLVTGRRQNIAHLIEAPGFRFLQHDLIQPLPEVGKVDRVMHLASPASPPGYQRYSVETMRVNSEGTLRLLELAEKHGAAFLYA